MIETKEILRPAKRNPIPCETPDCSANCTYAYSCHEQRMGRSNTVPWPSLALAIIAILVIVV